MCTAMTLQTNRGHILFGRTMDFSYPLDPGLYITPKGYRWTTLLNTHQFQTRYRFIGIGQDLSPLAFADGVNEMGFSAAVLYFPGYAHYETTAGSDTKIPLASLELIFFLLGQCASVDQAVSLLQTIRIVGVTDPVTNSVAPLHWMITDCSGRCAVIEQMDDGLHITENLIGVLSNSPDFGWHMTNLRNFMNVVPNQQKETSWDQVTLRPFGQGGGTFGLPGDYTPPSRFVRASYLKTHITPPETVKDAVTACFHILESVSIPKGCVMAGRNTPDYTQYTAFMSLTSKEYFYKTYDNSQVRTARLTDAPPSIRHPILLTRLNESEAHTTTFTG